jgi:erythromycin esterase
VSLAWAAAVFAIATGVAAAADVIGVVERDASDSAFIAWARSQAAVLRSVEPVASDSDLRAFCELAAHASVVALGEPAHGAHQPLALRNRVFTYLIEHCGFTAIAIETAFTESRAVHDYVAGGAGDPATITRQSLSWGFGDYAENAELVQWMHDYNRHQGSRRQIQFYGIDMSGADNDSGFPHPEVALNAVVEYLKTTAVPRSRKLLRDLAPAFDRISTIGYARLARQHDAVLISTRTELQQFLSDNAESLLRSGSRSKYDWAVQELVVDSALDEMLALDVEPERPGEAMPPGTFKIVNVRDAAMARNVMWVRGQEGNHGRILVFAHNAHVMNASSQGGIWSVFTEPPRMMGQHLRSALGNSLVIVGTSAGRNGDGLPIAPTLESSVDSMLEKVGLPLFLLNIRNGDDDPHILAWLRERRPLRANFSSELDLPLREAFDALVFIAQLTPAREIAAKSATTK